MVINMQPAADGRYPHHFTPVTCSSGDFGHLNVDRVIECVPRVDWTKIACKGIVRTAPQDFPAFGHLYHKNAAFFVPFHQIMEQSQAFFGNMEIDRGESVVMPHIKAFNINYLLGRFDGDNHTFSTLVDSVRASESPFLVPDKKTFDIVDVVNIGGDEPEYQFYKLTRRGRLFYGILKALGYDKVSFPYSSSYSKIRPVCDHDVNILNLLAYCKVYVDYFMSPQLFNTSELTAFLRCVKSNKDFVDGLGNTWYNASTGELSSYGLFSILSQILVPHEQSMYTQAWNSPNSPTGVMNFKDDSIGNSSLIGPYLSQTSIGPDSVEFSSTNTYLLNHNNNPLSIFTSFGQKLLNGAADLVRRYGLGGSSALQRLFAQFGVDLDDKKANYVHKLFEGSTDLTSTAIVSNADTVNGGDGKSLGALAGYVASSVEYSFNYQCRDYGVIVIVSWKQIMPIKLHGQSPAVLRMKPYDFWTPQFDGQAFRAIPYCEIGCNDLVNKAYNLGQSDNDIYGFTNLYDDYRNMPDIVTGDFINDFAQNFVIARDFSVLRELPSDLHPQSNVVQMYSQTNNSDITNPFQMDESVGDRFYNFFNFDIDCMSPILSGSSAFGIPNGDTPMQLNGQQVN